MPDNKRTNFIERFYLLHKVKIILVLEIILVLLFAFTEWYFKHRFYAIFIIVFFVIVSFFPDRNYKDFVIPIIFVFLAFNSLIADNILLFRRIDVPSIQHPKNQLINLFSPNTGLEVLPDEVQTMISMMHTANIDNYYLAPDLYYNGELMQRVVEGAWPIKLEESSPFIFLPASEMDL